MKRILITGKGSYIGTHFRDELLKNPEKYEVEELEMRNDEWRNHDFSSYDVVYHVVGIAHIKEVKENEQLYYQVNRDLAYDTAKKAKEEGVSQFIFMSSMSVYGLNYSDTPIRLSTACKPNTYYGISKYEAEKLLIGLEDDSFKVCIVRPPMVYGDHSPGNLTKLFKAVRKVHIFPTIKNQRSSITVEKLIEYIKKYIDEEVDGIHLPQNDEYMCTYEIVKQKMEKEGIYVFYTSLFNPIIKLMIGKVGLVTKCFGDLIYGK